MNLKVGLTVLALLTWATIASPANTVAAATLRAAPDPTTCLDQTNLESYFPANTTGTITLPPDTCWTTTSSLLLQGYENLTVEGNGDTVYGPSVPQSEWLPILELYQDPYLEIDDLTLVGPGTSPGGANYEGGTGIICESDPYLTLDGVTIAETSGDGIGFYPSGVHETPISWIYDGASDYVTVENSLIQSVGYHGITIEALKNATFESNNVNGVATDAIDMEYDGGIGAPDPIDGPGTPEDHISFIGNTFQNDLYVTLNVANTGSTTVNNLTFDDNQLTGAGTWSEFDISGVSGGYPVYDLSIEDNTTTAETGGPNPQDAIDLTDVDGATIEGNTFPWYWYVEPANTADLYKVAVYADSTSSGVDDENNTYIGALEPDSGNIAISCGNTYLVNAYQDQQITQPAC